MAKTESKGMMPFETLGKGKQNIYFVDGKEHKDTFAKISYTMVVSSAFKDLTVRQRMLYVYAKMQYFGARSRPKNDFEEVEEFKVDGGKKYFYLNHRLVSEIFELYPKTNKRDLYKDIKALISHGFIDEFSNGKKKYLQI